MAKATQAPELAVYRRPYRSATGFIYIAADGRGRHKIGFSCDLVRREKQLQWQFGKSVSIVHVSKEINKLAERVEIAAHGLLEHAHLLNEWFDAGLEETRAAVDKAIANVLGGDVPDRRAFEKARLPQMTVLMGGGSFLDGLDRLCAARRVMNPGEDYAAFIHAAVINETERRERAKKG